MTTSIPLSPTGGDSGDLQFYTVEYTDYFHLHMDLVGTASSANGKKTKDKFAPFSHDADAPTPACVDDECDVPEPGARRPGAPGERF